jgi:hypothetical protein
MCSPVLHSRLSGMPGAFEQSQRSFHLSEFGGRGGEFQSGEIHTPVPRIPGLMQRLVKRFSVKF